MCRLLYIKSQNKFDIQTHLQQFSQIAENSSEYQGHGWGCAYLHDDEWRMYKNVQPIWKDDLSVFGQSTMLVAHVRSAFRDEDIVVENNMPFRSGKYFFIFNGELHGVRIKENGRSGAAKIFNYIMRFHKGNTNDAISKSMAIIQKRSKYIRAANLIIADKTNAWVHSSFNQDADYFTMHYKITEDQTVICSDPYPDQDDWSIIENHSLREF